MEIASKYNPAEVEDKWYKYWMENRLFHSEPDEREPYTIVIPPPNVTGVLHMGHMLNNTIQDVLVRRARMQGKNACWVPGTDHASIATEAKVVARLASQGIKKNDLSRDEFLRHAWDWTHEHGGIILEQLKKLGASCDWDRTAFTMDEIRSESVLRVFLRPFRQRIDLSGRSHGELGSESADRPIRRGSHSQGSKRKIILPPLPREGEDDYAVVATTRPETIMGDTAMCIHPDDPKNARLKGKKVIVPLIKSRDSGYRGRICRYRFRYGCLKVTPHTISTTICWAKNIVCPHRYFQSRRHAQRKRSPLHGHGSI
jgi:valyl-tRNA synthetase